MNKNKQYQKGDIIKIKSPAVDHIHNDYCNCSMIVVLLYKDRSPNKELKKIVKLAYHDNNNFTTWFDPDKTWIVWNNQKGNFKLTESWMNHINA